MKKGQHIICKFEDKSNSNGDIIGVIESVRSDGHVLIKNLIATSERPCVKKISVVKSRAFVVSKAIAKSVVDVFKVGGKAAARKFAVENYKVLSEPKKKAPRIEKVKPLSDSEITAVRGMLQRQKNA